MAILTCRNCGATTNSAVCDHIDSKDALADRCYLKWQTGAWVKGCAYERADVYSKSFCDKLLADEAAKGATVAINPADAG